MTPIDDEHNGADTVAAKRDYGAEALAILLGAQGFATSGTLIRQEMGATAEPLRPQELQAAAVAFGFKCLIKTYAHRKFDQTPLPALVFRRDNHPVILARLDAERALVMDPALGKPQTLARDAFLADCDGRVLLVALAEQEDPIPFGWRWFWPKLNRHKGLIGHALVASIFIQLFALGTPLFVMAVTDKVLTNGAETTLLVLTIGLVLAALFEFIIAGLRSWLTAHTAHRIDAQTAAAAFQQLLALPAAFFNSRPAGAVAQRMRDLEPVRAFLTGAAGLVAVDLVFGVVIFAVMAQFSLKLSLLTLIAVVAVVALQGIAAPALQARQQRKAKLQGDNQAFLIETISGVETVKALALEAQMQRRWETQAAAERRVSFQSEAVGGAVQQAATLVNRLMTAGVLFFGARMVLDHELSAGQMLAFFMLSARILAPAQRLAQLLNQWSQADGAVKRLKEVFDAAPEPRRIGGASLPSLAGAVRFEHVCFRYQEQGPEVLSDLTLDIPAGQVVGIVGASGCGKTTLTRLMLRLHAPQRGKVLIDGVDLALIDPRALRTQIGVVTQDVFLFNASVRDNIAAADPAAPMAQVEHAAKLAGADAFIRGLPEGYDTKIGERGCALSGGQRQRLALARALMGDPKLLILDEATSALDYHSERYIHDHLRAMAAGRTVVVVTHRLAILHDVDRVLVMEGGRVVEDGAPAQLEAAPQGRYAALQRLHAGADLRRSTSEAA